MAREQQQSTAQLMSRRTLGQLLTLSGLSSLASPACAADVKIVVNLPADRSGYGTLQLLDGDGVGVAGPFGVLGMADQKTAEKRNNKDRSPILPFGDTPAGSYRVAGFVPSIGDDDRSRHGPNGKILLDPTSGDASLAKTNGRKFLEIHGGDLRNGQLRPTNGCLRLTNEDMLTLLTAIITLNQPPASCSVSEITVQAIQHGAPSEGFDDGDPPSEGSLPTPMPSAPAPG
jgi:hypothetical protein